MRISDWSSDVCSSDLRQMAQQRNAYSMALQASVAAEQPIVVREQQQFIDDEDEAVRIEPVAITSINVDLPTAANGVFIGERTEERGVGEESVSTCSYRWSRYH